MTIQLKDDPPLTDEAMEGNERRTDDIPSWVNFVQKILHALISYMHKTPLPYGVPQLILPKSCVLKCNKTVDPLVHLSSTCLREDKEVKFH